MQNPEIFYITNASPEDYDDLHNFFQLHIINYFGQRRKGTSLREIFYTQYITHRIVIRVGSVCKITIGYAEVSNYPAIPALPPELWPDFVNFHYCCNLPLRPTNTMFFNTFLYRDDHNPDMLKELLCEIFHRDCKLKFIVTFESPDYTLYMGQRHQEYYCLETFSVVYYPKCFSIKSCSNTQKMHVIQREHILTEMRYRKALPEDNDDIVEIVDQDHPDFKVELGEYYIAEEVLSNSKSLLIVTEIHHITAGFIWLSDDVNLLTLLENYIIEPFGHLIKFDAKEKFKEKILEISVAQKRPWAELFATEFVNQIFTNMSDIKIVKDSGSFSDSEKVLIQDYVRRKLGELDQQIKSYDYYFKVRRRFYGFYYNEPDDATGIGLEAKSNVFVIQLVGLRNTNDPRRIYRFLSTAFTAYPNKDYCLLSVKLAGYMPPTLLEVLKFFIPVAPRPGGSIEENLFISHRSTVFGDFSLFAVRQEDVENIKELIRVKPYAPDPVPKRLVRNRISTIADRMTLTEHQSLYTETHIIEVAAVSSQKDVDQVLQILDKILNDPYSEYKGYTIRCGDLTRPIDDNSTVGFVIIRPFYCNKDLKKHYRITIEDEILKFSTAELLVFKLHPLFHFQADLIFRELSRLTNFYHFYYFMPTDQYYLANDLIATMQPLEPRRTKKLWFSDNEPTTSSFANKIFYSQLINTSEQLNFDLARDHIAVFQANLRPTSFFGNSTNIVVLGFNDICKAFLRLMIFSWHDTLSKDSQATVNCLPQLNITVVCKPGVMEADLEHAFKCHICPKDKQIDCWLNYHNCDAFIRDVGKRMDVRTWIHFVSGEIKAIDAENCIVKMQSNCDIFYETLFLMCGTDFGIPDRIFNHSDMPPNYSHINNRLDKLVFYHKLNTIISDYPPDLEKKVIVYGCHIRAYEFINFLLKHGLKGSEIHLFLPYKLLTAQMDLVFNNSAEDIRIEEITREMLEDLGVTIYDQMNLRTYSHYDVDGNIKDVTFVKHVTDEELTIVCDLFISFFEVHLEDEILEILNLAYVNTEQSYVMVDENYQTSQPKIYAIGNFIKHKIEPNHQYRFVSPQEAAEKIISILDLIQYKNEAPEMEEKFSKPSYFQAQLPMDYFFIKVTCPKRYLANHLDNQYGSPLVTYANGDFSRVRLNEHGIVEEIVIVTQKKLHFDFLKYFCGLHELMLNNLKSRWYLKDIVSFLDFFQEPWVELIMHEEFEDLRKINKALIAKAAKEVMEKDKNRDSRRKLMYSYGRDMGITSQLEYALLNFIREHREDFPINIALPEDFPQTAKK